MDFIDDARFLAIRTSGIVTDKDSVPQIIDSDTVVFGGFKIKISAAIYESAKAAEVVDGWKMLQNEMPMDELFQPYFLETIREWKTPGFEYATEPIILELLRFCYWYYRCSQVDRSTFDTKKARIVSEMSADLGNISQYKVSLHYGKRFEVKGGKPYDDEFEKFYIKLPTGLWSVIAEVKFPVLASEAGLRVSFHKKHDFLIDDLPCEVKAINDEPRGPEHDEQDITSEIKSFIERNKVAGDIDNGIGQGGRIIFVDATRSTTGRFLNEKTSAENPEFAFEKTIATAVNNARKGGSFTPVVISASAIDCRSDGGKCNYKTVTFLRSVQVKKENKDKFKVHIADV